MGKEQDEAGLGRIHISHSTWAVNERAIPGKQLSKAGSSRENGCLELCLPRPNQLVSLAMADIGQCRPSCGQL